MEQHYFSCYKLLGIQPSASSEEIEKACKKKWLEYHPDKNDGSSLAEQLFKQVTEAKEILLNPQSRLEHDYALGIKIRPLPAPIIRYEVQPRKRGFLSFVGTALALYGGVKLVASAFPKKRTYGKKKRKN